MAFSEAIQADSPGDYVFQLKRGQTVSGVVYQPDGSPAAGAQVGLITDTGFTLNRGRLEGKSVSSRLCLTEADGNGRFKFRLSTNPKGIVSVHESGYRLLDFQKDESAEDAGTGERTIRLQEWAAVEGRLVLDGKPAADQEVRAIWPPEPVSDLYFKLFGFGSNFGDTTNNDGRFKIDKLIAGTYRVAQLVPGPKISDAFSDVGMPNHLISVDLNSGETARVTLGGEGRPVVGKAVLSDPQRQIDWTLYMAVLHGIPNPSKDPSKSAAGQIASSMMDDQGGFRMSDVPVGEYHLVINLKQDPMVSRYGFSTEQENIGSLRKTVVVEADPNGYPGSPMDLGTLTVPVDDLR